MATDEQLKTYADSLPGIYKEILSAFPRLEPYRKHGYRLAYLTLLTDFESRHAGYGADELTQACDELAAHGILINQRGIFMRPTDLGERLITLLTGHQAPVAQVPKLPVPPV